MQNESFAHYLDLPDGTNDGFIAAFYRGLSFHLEFFYREGDDGKFGQLAFNWVADIEILDEEIHANFQLPDVNVVYVEPGQIEFMEQKVNRYIFMMLGTSKIFRIRAAGCRFKGDLTAEQVGLTQGDLAPLQLP